MQNPTERAAKKLTRLGDDRHLRHFAVYEFEPTGREPGYDQPLDFRAGKLDDDLREIDLIEPIARPVKLSDRR